MPNMPQTAHTDRTTIELPHQPPSAQRDQDAFAAVAAQLEGTGRELIEVHVGTCQLPNLGADVMTCDVTYDYWPGDDEESPGDDDESGEK